MEPENLPAHSVIGEWLAAYARGEVSDPNTAYLDKVIREKVAAAGPARRAAPQSPPSPLVLDAELVKLIDKVTSGAPAETPAERRLSAALAEAAPLPEAAPAERPGESARLRQECSRAHTWRFHLESRARAVHSMVDRLLNEEKRAPTREEMRDIVDTLREAVEWAP